MRRWHDKNAQSDNKAFNSLNSTEVETLSETAQDFFHFVENFGKLHQLKDFISVWMLENSIQNLETLTCRPFQLYFFNNIFNPDENSKIQKHNKLTKKTIETLIQEIFTLEREENENRIRHYEEEMNIRLEWANWHLAQGKTALIYYLSRKKFVAKNNSDPDKSKTVRNCI